MCFFRAAATSVLLAVNAFAAAQFARAQSYPTRPIHLIVPYPAGGGTDFFARLIGQKISELVGQPVVVENKPGAATNLGADFVETVSAVLDRARGPRRKRARRSGDRLAGLRRIGLRVFADDVGEVGGVAVGACGNTGDPIACDVVVEGRHGSSARAQGRNQITGALGAVEDGSRPSGRRSQSYRIANALPRQARAMRLSAIFTATGCFAPCGYASD